MKATKVTVGDHPWKPFVQIICDAIVYFTLLATMFCFLADKIELPWWLFAPAWIGLSGPALFDAYQWLWKWRIRRWTMKNSEWIYDELHPKPDGSHDNI